MNNAELFLTGKHLAPVHEDKERYLPLPPNSLTLPLILAQWNRKFEEVNA